MHFYRKFVPNMRKIFFLAINTYLMKIKMLTRLSAAMLLGAFAVACTDEVPTIPSSELYTREFVKRFGNVDKEHTWNIAVRGDINVTVDRPSHILVSGIIGGKRYLLGDFAGR